MFKEVIAFDLLEVQHRARCRAPLRSRLQVNAALCRPQASMDTREARVVLESHLASYRARTYAELVAMVGAEPDVFEVSGAAGARYQIEVEAFWDSRKGGDVRVLACIDDGGWRAFSPLSDDFIMSPNGAFVGE